MGMKDRLKKSQEAREKKQRLFKKQNAGQQPLDGAASFLWHVRNFLELSQQGLADELERFGARCSQGVVARWENGSRTIPPESFVPLARALNCMPRQYLTDFVVLFSSANQLRQFDLRLRVSGPPSKQELALHGALRNSIMVTAYRLSYNLTGKAINR